MGKRCLSRQLIQITAIAPQCLGQETAQVAHYHGSGPPAATHASLNPAAYHAAGGAILDADQVDGVDDEDIRNAVSLTSIRDGSRSNCLMAPQHVKFLQFPAWSKVR
jgi:hypothetical protein